MTSMWGKIDYKGRRTAIDEWRFSNWRLGSQVTSGRCAFAVQSSIRHSSIVNPRDVHHRPLVQSLCIVEYAWEGAYYDPFTQAQIRRAL